MKYFVDTNIFLRFLLADHPQQSSLTKNLFQKAVEGKIKLITLPIVIAEIVWVLSSYYKEPIKEVVNKIRLILVFKGLEVLNKQALLIALQLFETEKIDFIDAYLAGWMNQQKIKNIYSFDKDFDRIEFIKRLELECR